MLPLPFSRSSLSDPDFRSPSGDDGIARASSDDADMAFTCEMTTCARIASSSSSFILCCLHAARFSASRARFSAAVRVRFSVGDSGAELWSACLCWILSFTRFSASSASSLFIWSDDRPPGRETATDCNHTLGLLSINDLARLQPWLNEHKSRWEFKLPLSFDSKLSLTLTDSRTLSSTLKDFISMRVDESSNFHFRSTANSLAL